MAYKKSKPIIAGTKTHSRAIQNLSLNRGGNVNMPDGRSKSSPFQIRSPFKVEPTSKTVVGKTKTDKKTTDLGGNVFQVDTTDTTPTTTTTENPAVTSFRKRCYGPNGERLVGKKGCKWDDSGNYVPPEDTSETTEDVKKTQTCYCVGPDGKQIPYEAPEGKCKENKPAECDKEPETPEKTPEAEPCYCLDATTGERVTMECGTHNSGRPRRPGSRISSAGGYKLPPQCAKDSKIMDFCNGMTLGEYRAKKEECESRGTKFSRFVNKRYFFDRKTCDCKERSRSGGGELVQDTKENIKDAFKCMKNGFMSKNGKPTKIPCAAYDGIKTDMN